MCVCVVDGCRVSTALAAPPTDRHHHHTHTHPDTCAQRVAIGTILMQHQTSGVFDEEAAYKVCPCVYMDVCVCMYVCTHHHIPMPLPSPRTTPYK